MSSDCYKSKCTPETVTDLNNKLIIFFFTFQYICYPWKNDDQIDPKNRRKTCRQDDDCDPGQECFRHHDKRMVNRGLCFDEVSFSSHFTRLGT